MRNDDALSLDAACSSGGSYSIKSVLPTVGPHLAHEDLEIQEGAMTSIQFHRMVMADGDAAEKARLHPPLLKCGERDTLAMVKLRRALPLKAHA